MFGLFSLSIFTSIFVFNKKFDISNKIETILYEIDGEIHFMYEEINNVEFLLKNKMKYASKKQFKHFKKCYINFKKYKTIINNLKTDIKYCNDSYKKELYRNDIIDLERMYLEINKKYLSLYDSIIIL